MSTTKKVTDVPIQQQTDDESLLRLARMIAAKHRRNGVAASSEEEPDMRPDAQALLRETFYIE
jgi:hypothetical protein